MFSKSLRHYSERLIRLKEDDDIKKANNILKQDLDENSKKALEIAGDIDQYKSNNTISDYLTLIKCALVLYKNDLIEGSSTIQKKIGVRIPLRNVGGEIKHIENIFEARGWDEPKLDSGNYEPSN